MRQGRRRNGSRPPALVLSLQIGEKAKMEERKAVHQLKDKPLLRSEDTVLADEPALFKRFKATRKRTAARQFRLRQQGPCGTSKDPAPAHRPDIPPA